MTYVQENNLSYEYWIVFSYFLFNYPKIENKTIFTYYFCEFVLLYQIIGETMNNLLLEIDNKYNDIKYTNISGFQILDKLMLLHRTEINKNLSNVEILLQKTENKYILKSKNRQFYSILNKLLGILRNGLEYRKQNSTIFNANDIVTSAWINNMCKIVLSPVIKQPNNEFRVLFDDENYVNEIFVFFAVTIIIEKYINNEMIEECPFCKEIPICDEYIKGVEKICMSEPFNIKKFPEGGCAFYNACLILGILSGEELEKYIK
jgi:hypothetical protein